MKVFVFGSNEAGIHGAGAAKFAKEHRGARMGRSYGMWGKSFAIPTKNEVFEVLPLNQIEDYVRGFIAFARGKRKLTFQVTAIGTGLAGYKHEIIAPMFLDAPRNCFFDERWKPILGEDRGYFQHED